VKIKNIHAPKDMNIALGSFQGGELNSSQIDEFKRLFYELIKRNREVG